MIEKERTNITLDNVLKKRAEDLNLNISELAEDAIRKRLGLVNSNIPLADGERCEFCGKVEAKATREHLNGLTWLCPDEKWICDSCLNNEMRKVIVSR